MFEKAILPLALGACLAFAAPAWAEGDSPDNPKPLADDVALPLPCGGEMVFRHVYVLAEGSSTIARSASATPSAKARRATSSRSSPATGATT